MFFLAAYLFVKAGNVELKSIKSNDQVHHQEVHKLLLMEKNLANQLIW